ncbi:GNAT family N-acetyltransferase [Epilithonimonas hungarica]|uniref:Acetyltransferase (GNAT) domain-containing protein n=1 Tax=Epilithonimonas hungarica TaxID=454006 RepID=A0A1G7N576_9FLAO|nr:GNAT family N-acetyltransferase [Epilithonimonas hungarica]MDP9954570.1 GNAT superfamily N-acetyltransferase [Epilithonimonas hungarica]SDF69091.1 Acetyltransferase (GNAT) domain-containing protein [Epilithonimonas hungarica]
MHEKKDFYISTDKSKMDIETIHHYLSEESYWAKGVSREIVEKSIANSFCFGVFHQDLQVGFAKVITDFTTIAYLGDVFILDEFRGLGLSKLLMENIMNHPELQGLRRWILLTADAHELYKKFGWNNIKEPARWMEVHTKNPYQ